MSSSPSPFRGVAAPAQQPWPGGGGVASFNAKRASSIPADLFDRRGEPGRRVELTVLRGRLLIREGSSARTIPLDSIRFHRRGSGLESEAILPDGGTCKIPDGAVLAAMIEGGGQPDKATRGKYQRLSIILLGIVLFAFLAQTIAQIAPHILADELAPRIPSAWVRASSVRLLAELDHSTLQPSDLPEVARKALQEQFAALQPPAEGAPPYRLLLRKSRELGAACFALPNGDIVLTDAFWTSTARTDLRLWLMLRALGHLHYRHALDNVTRTQFGSLLFAVLTGNKELGVRALDRALRVGRYSAMQRSDADGYASRMLEANGNALSNDSAGHPSGLGRMHDAPPLLRQVLNDDRVIPIPVQRSQSGLVPAP